MICLKTSPLMEPLYLNFLGLLEAILLSQSVGNKNLGCMWDYGKVGACALALNHLKKFDDRDLFMKPSMSGDALIVSHYH